MKKLIAALGIAGTLAFAVPVFAQSIIPTYTAPYTVPYTPSYGSCPALSYNLYVGLGDRHTAGQVTALQRYLSAQGYYQPVTGFFGSITRANVASLQGKLGVYPMTGGVGPLTRAAIARTCGTAPTPTPTGSVFYTNVPFTLSAGQQAQQYQGQLDVTLGQIISAPSYTMYYPGYQPALSAQITLGQRCLLGTQCFYYPQQQATLGLGQSTTWQGYTITLTAITNTTATFVVSTSGTGQQASLTVSSPANNQTYSRGGTMSIVWNGSAGSYGTVSSVVDLYSVSGGKIGTIAIQSGASGSFSWTVPPFPNNLMCTMQYPNALCGASIPDGQYYVKVSLVSGNGFDSGPTIASANSGTVTIGSSASAAVSASPQTGVAPFTTTFTLGNYSGYYRVDYGDGMSASLVSGPTSHTYYNRGTYTATFMTDYACLHSTPSCKVAQQTLGSVTVTAY